MHLEGLHVPNVGAKTSAWTTPATRKAGSSVSVSAGIAILHWSLLSVRCSISGIISSEYFGYEIAILHDNLPPAQLGA